MKCHCDLHIHSCLSPCGDADMTPNNIAGMAALMGFQAVALADHNTTRNCRAFDAAAKRNGILAIPAMELTTSEEVHVLCLLPDLDAADAFDKYVYARLPDIPNRADIFGEQLLLDGGDEPVGVEPRLLLTATSIGVYDIAALIKDFGGAAIPAHIDRNSFSVLSNLGLWDEGMGFAAYEVFDLSLREKLLEKYPGLRGLKYISNSDAHYLENMRDPAFALELERLSAKAVIEYFNS